VAGKVSSKDGVRVESLEHSLLSTLTAYRGCRARDRSAIKVKILYAYVTVAGKGYKATSYTCNGKTRIKYYTYVNCHTKSSSFFSAKNS